MNYTKSQMKQLLANIFTLDTAAHNRNLEFFHKGYIAIQAIGSLHNSENFTGLSLREKIITAWRRDIYEERWWNKLESCVFWKIKRGEVGNVSSVNEKKSFDSWQCWHHNINKTLHETTRNEETVDCRWIQSWVLINVRWLRI